MKKSGDYILLHDCREI